MTVGASGRDVPAVASPPDNVTIRPWAVTDMAAIGQLSAAEGWTTVQQRPDAALAAWRRSDLTLVAEAGGDAVGFLRALTDGAVTTYVAELLVAPPYRGRGIARAMLDACQRAHPGTRLDLLATTDSRDVYPRVGFRPFPGYRRGWGEGGTGGGTG